MTKRRFVTYAPGAASNAAAYGPGIGRTREEAERNARYWANQSAHVRTVPLSRAPKWAIGQAIAALRSLTCVACGGPLHPGVCVDARGDVLPEFRRRADEFWSLPDPGWGNARFWDGELAV